MHSFRLSKTALGALVAFTLLSAAHAQLFLSGHLTGEFTNDLGPNDTLFNAPDGSSAWFRSGNTYGEGSVQTEIAFTQKNFTDVGSGSLVADDIFEVTNGRNLLNSTATAASFDLHITLTSPEAHSGLLTSIPFVIENTPNNGALIDDMFEISSSPIEAFDYAGYRLQFQFVAPNAFSLAENQSTNVGALYVTFTPVPEPATYAAGGAALLIGLIGYRALRRRKTSMPATI